MTGSYNLTNRREREREREKERERERAGGAKREFIKHTAVRILQVHDITSGPLHLGHVTRCGEQSFFPLYH